MSAAFYQKEEKFFVATDCIILGFNNKELNVLLHKRTFEPLKGEWSLMGGFVRSGESVNEAASRVLTECTGIDSLFMEQVGAYGDVTRDLGERVISVAYYALVNMNDFNVDLLEQYDAQWTKLSDLPELIFDHKQMIHDTLSRLKRKAGTRPVGFNLLPDKFTLPQLQTLYEAIYQAPLDKRNFRKKLHAMDILEKLDEKDKKSSKRGAFYYMFNKEKYDKLLDDGFYFSL
jgi:ADP-ribose pyrophosphatase YjhB (NUDIX family)